jgi:hypothetical protein
MFGGTPEGRGLLKILISRGGHQLEFWKNNKGAVSRLDSYDLVVIDGTSSESGERARVLDILLREVRQHSCKIPVVVLSFSDDAVHDDMNGYSYGVDNAHDGVWHVRCSMQQRVWSEGQTLLPDTMERPKQEPVISEYQA